VLAVIETLCRAGAEQSLVNMLPALGRYGYHCEVAALWPPYDLATALESRGIRVHRLNVRHRWSVPEAVAKLVGVCLRGRFDILHGQLFFAAVYTALTRPLLPQARRVVTYQNVTYELEPTTTAWKKVRKALDVWLMRYWADAHTAVSHAVADYCARHLGLAGVPVIPNAIPTDQLRPEARLDRSAVLQRFGLAESDFVLIMPARLVHQKGHTYLFQALRRLAGGGLFPKVLALGNGPLREALGRQVRDLRLERQVSFREAIPQTELFPLLQAADVFVMPSTHEGFGIAPAEAMTLGRPVLVTRVAGLSELVENEVSGLVVPPADPAALADGIARLMHDADLGRCLGQGGRRRILERFSVGQVAALWADFYEGLLTIKAPGREARRHVPEQTVACQAVS
jgi:glycosyltransferase involved in cell wall biosynthesis